MKRTWGRPLPGSIAGADSPRKIQVRSSFDLLAVRKEARVSAIALGFEARGVDRTVRIASLLARIVLEAASIGSVFLEVWNVDGRVGLTLAALDGRNRPIRDRQWTRRFQEMSLTERACQELSAREDGAASGMIVHKSEAKATLFPSGNPFD